MPRFEDKRKPVNIYADGSAARKVQDKMNASVGNSLQGLANIVDTYAGGAGVRQMGRGLQSLAKPITDPLMAGRNKQREYFANKEINAMPAAVATTQNPHGQTSYVRPMENKVVNPLTNQNTVNRNNTIKPLINETSNAQRDQELGKMTALSQLTPDGGETRTFDIGGNTLSYDLSKKDLAIKNNLVSIDQRIAQGFTPTPEQAKRIQELRMQAGFTRGGIDQINKRQNSGGLQELGNLDVQFDSSVDQADRRRFLKDPVRPTTQMNKNKQKNRFDFSGILKGMGQQTPEIDPLQSIHSSGRAELYTKKNSPNMDYRERKALNVQILRNNQSNNNNKNAMLISAANRRGINNLAQLASFTKAASKKAPKKKKQENKPPRKINSKVIDVDDGMNGTRKAIFNQREDGSWYDATPKKQLADNHPALKLLKDNLKNPLYRQTFMETYGYLPTWAEAN